MSQTPDTADEKYRLLNRLLLDEHALVHLNPKAEGVELPQHLHSQSSVTLKLSRLFRGSLLIAEDKITSELLFHGSYFTCVIPFAAVWGITSEKGKTQIWTEGSSEKAAQLSATKNGEGSKKGTHLRRVK